MYKFSANYIYLGNGEILKYGIIKLNESGVVTEIIDTKGVLKEEPSLQFYGGIIVPGFINTHCHLELSYFWNKINQHTHLWGFISDLQKQRKQTDPLNLIKAAQTADKRMKSAGIVAVADISNDNYTIEVKKNSTIKYLNLIETFSTQTHLAEKIFSKAQELQMEFETAGLEAHIVPHAPYSVSKKLFQLISENQKHEKTILSIHNQETEDEDLLFKERTGNLHKTFKDWGINFDYIEGFADSSLQYTAPFLDKNAPILLVHNTFSKKEDVIFAQNHFNKVAWVLCPNANLFIENQLPDLDVLTQNANLICLGTDSLASNHSLSIFDEMKTIQLHYPQISFETLVKWATSNGAKALGIENQFGSIEIGKKPGLNLISHFDFKNNKLLNNSVLKVLF